MFDRNGKVTKEDYNGLTAQQLFTKYDAALKEANDPNNPNNYSPLWIAECDKVLKKYGKKALTALSNFELYIGFPESLLREHIFYNPEKWSNGFGIHTFQLLANYGSLKLYAYNGTLRTMLGGKYEHCRIWCRNGKVSGIEYDYYGPF